MKYLNLTPFYWFLMQQGSTEVVYRLRANPFIEAVITEDKGCTFVGYGPFTENPELNISKEARQEALALSRCLTGLPVSGTLSTA